MAHTSKKRPTNIAEEIIVCHKCKLHKTRKNAVPGEGNIDSQIMFIGEAPGYSEDLKGKPFVGDAGKFLDILLEEANLLRDSVFITNIVKCRPPNNREPSTEEIITCSQYLDRQIQVIKPKIIITLGNHSTTYIFHQVGLPFDGITQVHGRFFKASISKIQTTIFPTFHPASALYNPKYKNLLLQDFRAVKVHLQ
jgi:DNA polymerase